MAMNTAEILRAAAQRVRQGWDNARFMGESRDCALHAIRKVMGIRSTLAIYEPASDVAGPAAVLARVLCLPYEGRISVFDTPLRRVTDWNDAPGQTAENVAQGLEYAALIFEQEQAQQTQPTQEHQTVTT